MHFSFGAVPLQATGAVLSWWATGSRPLQSLIATAKASLVLDLTIALIVLNAFSAWRPKTPKDKTEPKGTKAQHILITLGAGTAIVASLLTGTDWCARLFSPPPTVIAVTRSQAATNMPDSHGEILLANSSAATIFGYSVTEMMGQTTTRFVPQSCSDVSYPVTEMIGVHKDGAEFVAEVSFGKVANNNK